MGLRTNKLAALVEELHLVQVGWDVVEASLALRADFCPIIGLCSAMCQKANEEYNHHEKNTIEKYWATIVVEVGLWSARLNSFKNPEKANHITNTKNLILSNFLKHLNSWVIFEIGYVSVGVHIKFVCMCVHMWAY